MRHIFNQRAHRFEYADTASEFLAAVQGNEGGLDFAQRLRVIRKIDREGLAGFKPVFDRFKGKFAQQLLMFPGQHDRPVAQWNAQAP